MAWIRMVDEHEAEGALGEAYGRVRAARGAVANILKIHSVSPPALTAHLDLYRVVMFGASQLSRRERETIAVAVSSVNGCHY
jgi:alkylhydroperoxidase family enzyme